MMLTVWLTLPASEVVKVGELAIDDPDARGALIVTMKVKRKKL